MVENIKLGQIAFLGSGETSLAGGRIFEALARNLGEPLHIAVVETPAGFELNSDQVAGRVGDFLRNRLQNYRPVIDIVPARKRGTAFSPDDPEILGPLRYANLIFLGPGSPTYAVRQLKDTLAWDLIRARHRLGATLVFASAAAISAGAWALPVYEIYKVGEDVHVVPGLNFFGDFGLHISIISHWNNAEGGADLDTSRCFVGMERFAAWCDLLPAGNTTIGLDEHTGLILDFETGRCAVSGVSSVSLVRECNPEIYASGANFDLQELGPLRRPEPADQGISRRAWELAVNAPRLEEDLPSAEVLGLAEKRLAARARKDFAEADKLRDQIATLGWQLRDGKDGQKLIRSGQ